MKVSVADFELNCVVTQLPNSFFFFLKPPFKVKKEVYYSIAIELSFIWH